jgi:hypothetical protein
MLHYDTKLCETKEDPKLFFVILPTYLNLPLLYIEICVPVYHCHKSETICFVPVSTFLSGSDLQSEIPVLLYCIFYALMNNNHRAEN